MAHGSGLFEMDLSDDSLRAYCFPGGIQVHFSGFNGERVQPSRASEASICLNSSVWATFESEGGDNPWRAVQHKLWQYEHVFNAGQRHRSRIIREAMDVRE